MIIVFTFGLVVCSVLMAGMVIETHHWLAARLAARGSDFE